MVSFTRPGVERVGIALVPAGVGAVLSYAVLCGLGSQFLMAVVVSITLAAAGGWWVSRCLPTDLDGALHRHTLLAILWCALGVGAIGATGRLATFMVDETRTEHSIFAFDDFFVHHSCLSAHYQSARLQRAGVPNVYERTHFEGPNGEPRFVGSFVIDVFIYPPPFLLLSRLGLALSEDFAAWRAVWFGLEGAIVAGTILAVAIWVGGRIGRKAALLSPVIWLSLPLLLTLQHGNFQLVAIAGSMLAMLAFERERHAVGGALLAALVLSKIFPGILVLLLLFQRRWRDLVWTAGFGVVFLVIAFAVLGADPFRAMISYNLPRLSSGAALETQFAHPDAIAANHAVYGVVQKLSLLGVPGMTQGTAVAVSWLYTGVLIAFAALGARASSDRLPRGLVWLTLLHLASLRSPFTPDVYAQFPLLWISVLVLAGLEWQGGRPLAMVGLILLANLIVPTVPLMPVSALLGITLAYQALFLVFCIGVLVTQSSRAPTNTHGRSATS